MAFIKKESREGVSENEENCDSCANNHHGEVSSTTLKPPVSTKTDTLMADELNSTNKGEEAKPEASEFWFKQGHNGSLAIKYESDSSVDNAAHSDHNYVGMNEGAFVKGEILIDAPVNNNIAQNGKSLPNIVKQESKVPLQDGETHIKDEAQSEEDLSNVPVKTEASDVNIPVKSETDHDNVHVVKSESVDNTESESGSQYSRNPTVKCSKCNLTLRSIKLARNVLKIQKCEHCDFSPITKKLIEHVRKYPCLYNPNNANYKNAQIKNVMWTHIASECSLPNGFAAKTEWKKLKRDFITALNQQNILQGNHIRKLASLKYQQLEFLIPFINNRSTETDTENDNLNRPSEINHAAQAASEIHDADEDFTVIHSTPPPKKQKIISPQREVANVPKTPKRMREEHVESPRREEARPSTSSQPLDMFFLSMCATTKNLPSYIQLQVKKKIFQAVVEAEEVVAQMNNDQHQSNTNDGEYPSNMSPFSVHSEGEEWQDN